MTWYGKNDKDSVRIVQSDEGNPLVKLIGGVGSHSHERSILMPGEPESTEDVFVCWVCGEPAVEAVKFPNGQVRYYCAECI